MPELGSFHRELPLDGTTELFKLNLASLWHVKAAAANRNEYRITSATATIQVVNRLNNDGDVVAILNPKQWTKPSADAIRNQTGFEKHVSAAPWTIQLTSSGEWTNVANDGATMWAAGVSLAKATTIHVTVRGHVQYR